MNSAQPDILGDLIANGGGTYDAETLVPYSPNDGYAVGLGGIKMRFEEFKALEPEGREYLLWAVGAELSSSHVGTWLRSSDLTVHIDAVLIFPPASGQDAYKCAIANRQQEVYDFAAKRSIRPGSIVFDQ